MPVGNFGGTNKFEYTNSVKAVQSNFTTYWYFNVIIYKCVALCTTCGGYNSTAGWGDCTTCSPGYAVSLGDCIVSLCGNSKVDPGETCDDGD